MTKPQPKQQELTVDQEFLLNAVMFESEKKLRAIKGNLSNQVKSRVKVEMEQYEETRQVLRKSVRLLIMKTNVLSEVNFVSHGKPDYHELLSIIASAFDEPDSWWWKREHYSMDGWVESLREYSKEIEKRRKNDSTIGISGSR